MKLQKGAIGVGLVLSVVATVLLVLLPTSVNLYIGYSCCLLGIVMMVLGAVFFDHRDVPGSLAQLLQAAWFLPVSLFLSALVLIGQQFVTISPILHGTVQFILCAIAAIRLIKVQTGKDTIRNIDRKVAESTVLIAD